MSTETIKVPDIGGDSDVQVIEICVAVGDTVEVEQSLIVLESDKASMDIPSPKAGVVKSISVNLGDAVSEGSVILELEVAGAVAQAPVQAAPAPTSAPAPIAPVAASAPAATVSQVQTVNVPDIGDSGEVEVIEISVAVGDTVAAEDTLIVLESDKASMEIPAPFAGKVVEILVSTGAKVSEGHAIIKLETVGSAPVAQAAPAPQAAAPVAQVPAVAPAPTAAVGPVRKEVRVPDLSGNTDVPVIEVSVAVGDQLKAEDALLVLETDKATMEVPAPFTGKLVEFNVKEGQTLNVGDLIGVMEVMEADSAVVPAAASASVSAPVASAAAPVSAPVAAVSPAPVDNSNTGRKTGKVHAGPAVRMIAREFGVDLLDVTPTGPRDRILKEDVQLYVKQVMQQVKAAPVKAAAPAITGGAGIPPVPAVDFSQFGEIEEKPMGRLLKAGAVNLHRSWLNVPHVTQFDEADITELESFRKSMKAEADKRGAKLTPMPFILKACAYALQKYPQFNVSLHPDGDKLIQKKYVHIGFAVDTPDGLLVPVVRDVDQKSLWQLADETADLAARAQKKQLKGDDMKGGCFTISSLGSIGGTAFTPIVNAPEVAILGVSKASMKPVWNGSDFVPRQMLPLSLSYDHRAINGADAARFTAFIAAVLADIRQMLM
ncbi:pyruvate dehydrogenase E2 component (dihydrolipoamide acetyltransferase) [Oceanospirillum multiglobuliferum]|uniref:Acetyltransferase component of pyruvate dehydrogenase complex n=1 Tax=Oceanospirillum multiglobuliferum TaxID=64969 RepID=A0A1T4L8J2_9GAMM|nr:dihydrolipoyllysine-residue acetyltransferase [Oceanospirillum multiglobuliferum]OPX56755.1 pyruvate dehydrogenase complex dihydrolipoyllysine-residue acetyltransferase [Oceanospirillum multiglobuliferum]SJZ50984.1 pyruvate dehydrogenase E2 component (dihydrolipoamide acetyltransferase) [Oceanospirillum multiglobuliferum]